jgi:hypothetical protein
VLPRVFPQAPRRPKQPEGTDAMTAGPSSMPRMGLRAWTWVQGLPGLKCLLREAGAGLHGKSGDGLEISGNHFIF